MQIKTKPEGRTGRIPKPQAREEPPSFLKAGEVCRRTSLSRAQIYRLVAAGTFPRPVAITEGRRAWVASEIAGWMTDKIEGRP